MSAAAERHTPSGSDRFVIPVRYVARGEVVQTTSTALTPRAVHVRSIEPPNPGLIVALKLYFPSAGEAILRDGAVAGVTSDPAPGFWVHFSDDERGSARIAELLAQHREVGDRGCTRVPTDLPARVRARDVDTAARVTNMSRSGAFVQVDPCPPLGAVIELKLSLPEPGPETNVLALVIHAAQPRGVGVQYIGGTDVFRSRVDQHLASLAA